MKILLILIATGFWSSLSFAQNTGFPVVHAKAVYDYRRVTDGVIEDFIQTKEVVAVDPVKKTYSEKDVFLKGATILKEGIVLNQPFELYQQPWQFDVRCATNLNGQTVDGVKYAYELSPLTVPAGTFKVCHIHYSQDGLIYDEYVAADLVFNNAKVVITDPTSGIVRTSELRSIDLP